MTDVLTMTFPADERFEAARTRAYAGFVELVSRAKATGRLRPDFSPEDLAMVLMANAGVVNATGDAAPGTWRRLVAYFIQAFAAEAAQPLPDSATPEEMHRAQRNGRLPNDGNDRPHHLTDSNPVKTSA